MKRLSLPLCSPAKDAPLCPSSQPEMPGAVVFGVIDGTIERPHVTHLVQPLPATDEVLSLSGPVMPTEVFRIAAPCVGTGCKHFDGSNCRLVTRIVDQLPAVAEVLPPCTIRPSCRWWQQEGKAACMRCPQIVTHNYFPDAAVFGACDPNVYEASHSE